ncbi:hypothetical protein FRC04_007076 [Tulasnella sp. 424]|nr:hypothetical protein FRC04_007076 [Tulasnella sp. 424]KAG8976902.1 hypothetical protein FRC05_002839 [Tulasnella sp. 425]
MAPLSNEINAASSNAGLNSRGNDGISLTDVEVRRNNPTYIKYKWSHHNRSPEKFTVWFRNIKTKEYYKARETVWTSAGQGQVGLGSLNHRTGDYLLVLTKHNNYNKVFAKSSPFEIRNSDFS